MQDKPSMASYATDMPQPERGRRGRGWMVVICVVVVVILISMAKNIFFAGSNNFPPVRGSEWQAVFLTNNQVYFGHLKNYGMEYASLSNIFYLRAADSLQPSASTPPGSALQLVKLGSELHGPQDVMYIPKDKIMFWENLKPDSQVVQAIAASLNQK